MATKDWEKNTKKAKKSFKETRWDNKQGAESISVVYDGEDWRVWIHDTFGDEELKPEGFKTQDKALKFAKQYMRTH